MRVYLGIPESDLDYDSGIDGRGASRRGIE